MADEVPYQNIFFLAAVFLGVTVLTAIVGIFLLANTDRAAPMPDAIVTIGSVALGGLVAFLVQPPALVKGGDESEKAQTTFIVAGLLVSPKKAYAPVTTPSDRPRCLAD